MKRIGIIGCGNMGSAMLSGMLASGQFQKEEIMVYHHRPAAAQQLKERFGMKLASSYQDIMDWSDVIILGVKPHAFSDVINEIRLYVRDEQIMVSIAAGNTIEQIERWFGRNLKVIRLMPNTPVMVRSGMTAMMPNSNITDDDLQFVMTMCTSFGQCEIVSESLIDAVTAVSGSSPAYVYMFIEALADGAVREGMKREQAYRFASQAVLGAAQMVLSTSAHPGVLKDAVCSPGGTTIAAVNALEKGGLRSIIMDAVYACAERSREMKK